MEKRSAPQAGVTVQMPGEVTMERVLLASASPRRAEILRAVGWPFETLATNIDETMAGDESAEDAVKRLALEKALAAMERKPAPLVLGADTTVVVDSLILGKPNDDAEARRMLRQLGGRWHDVVTGVALVSDEGRRVVAHERTRVRFKPLSDAEIEWYVASGEPRDKAGAYAVQGRAALFIEEIEGDYWNVVGLPVRLVYKLAADIRRPSAE
ncbi:MAG TPA: Maf family protein [Pyrinomonadaceae bacterium]|nr:Maf family protein [Pyrinomonadaceae bacterium]